MSSRTLMLLPTRIQTLPVNTKPPFYDSTSVHGP